MNFKGFVFWTKNRLVRRKAFNAYKQAMSFDSLSGMEKASQEFEKQKSLVEYAYAHVYYYRDYYDSVGFNPSMLNSPEDWSMVPVLEKDVVRNNYKSLLSDEYKESQLEITTTGGSTGTPLKVLKMRNVPVEVMGWRALKWWGVSPASNTGILHRRTPTSWVAKLKNRLLWWPTKRAYLNASTMKESDASIFVNDLKCQKTVWLQGYCSALEFLADFIIKNDIIITSVKIVWSTSSPLSKTARLKIEKAFNCPVMDQYGCCEMWNVAIQKPYESYLTICNDFVHVDIVDEENKICPAGVSGDVLITDLNSFGFPLIKYRLGDKSSIAKTCEQSDDGYPKLNFVKGRITDSIILPENNGCIDGAFLTTICDSFPDTIDSFQIYQKLDYSVTLKLVLKKNTRQDDESVNTIIESMRSKLDESMCFNYEIVDFIPGDRGKKRYIISEVALEKQKH